jgi:hypothetical protein
MVDQGSMENIQVSVATDKARYQVGEPVVLTLTVLNAGANPVAIVLPTAEHWGDIAIRSVDGVTVWNFWWGRGTLDYEGVLRLMPMEPKTLSGTWDQRNTRREMDNRVPPGVYTATGLFYGHQTRWSAPVEFTISDTRTQTSDTLNSIIVDQ